METHIRVGAQIFGLIQFNDHRPNRFTPDLIDHFERMADSLAIALSQRQAEEALLLSRNEWELTFDSMPDMIAILDDRHRILRLNRAMANRLNFTPDQSSGLICHACVHGTAAPPASCPHVRTMTDGREHMAELYEERLGGYFLVSTTPLFNNQGKLIGSVHVARDITERKNQEERLKKLNRTLMTITHGSKALMRAADESAYLGEICNIIVNDCDYAMVWIGYAENDDAKSVRPVASCGFDAGYLETLNITYADTERGRGPTGAAIRTGRMSTCRNMLTDPRFAPWREEALKRGYASSLVLPLMADGSVLAPSPSTAGSRIPSRKTRSPC